MKDEVLRSLAWLIGTNDGKFWSIHISFEEPMKRYVVDGDLESVFHAWNNDGNIMHQWLGSQNLFLFCA